MCKIFPAFRVVYKVKPWLFGEYGETVTSYVSKETLIFMLSDSNCYIVSAHSATSDNLVVPDFLKTALPF